MKAAAKGDYAMAEKIIGQNAHIDVDAKEEVPR